MTLHRSAGIAPPPPDEGEPALVELIRDEISLLGPISFARFMERAMYEPGLGYYATSADRPTRAGDFLTAPELHPIFGWTVARQIDEMWRRLGELADFVVREFGAGTGSFGDAIRDGLRRAGSPLEKALRYEPVEVPGRLEEVPRAGPMVGCVLANEFLDALPVHRIVFNGTEWEELLVDWQDGNFTEVTGELSDARLVERAGQLAGDIGSGQQVEVNLAMADWLRALAPELERGFILLFDYARPRSQFLTQERASGTVRAFRGQHVSSDVLSGVGHQDITATVDLDALHSDAAEAGFAFIGRTTQAEFLMGCGFDDIYQAARIDADRDWKSALELRSAVRRLLDPLHLGGYSAIVLGKDVDEGEPLSGLSFALAGRA